MNTEQSTQHPSGAPIPPVAAEPPTSRPSRLIAWCEQGYIPDALARLGMRRLMRDRLNAVLAPSEEERLSRIEALAHELRASPIAIETAAANVQHYEVPAEFFHAHLGPHLKYSSAYYRRGTESLGEAEEAMFSLYVERAELRDGQRILDLGCGWGSFSLWLAKKLPNATITGLSNSSGQRAYIEEQARSLGLNNLTIVTANIVEFDFEPNDLADGFDRIVSIEMFEHMKNYALLLHKISGWLRPEGKLFVHIFAHRKAAYHFEVKDSSDWMTQYFFAGGLMPSEDLLQHFQEDLQLRRQWWVNGRHYERTANDWLRGMDQAKERILGLFAQAYGREQASLWFQRWRMFYMAVAELFGYEEGNQWGVAHYLFAKPMSPCAG